MKIVLTFLLIVTFVSCAVMPKELREEGGEKKITLKMVKGDLETYQGRLEVLYLMKPPYAASGPSSARLALPRSSSGLSPISLSRRGLC